MVRVTTTVKEARHTDAAVWPTEQVSYHITYHIAYHISYYISYHIGYHISYHI